MELYGNYTSCSIFLYKHKTAKKKKCVLIFKGKGKYLLSSLKFNIPV